MPACLPPRISITYVGTSLAGPPLPWRGYTQPGNGGSPMCMVLQWGQMWFDHASALRFFKARVARQTATVTRKSRTSARIISLTNDDNDRLYNKRFESFRGFFLLDIVFSSFLSYSDRNPLLNSSFRRRMEERWFLIGHV